jgi:hypothetical protein
MIALFHCGAVVKNVAVDREAMLGRFLMDDKVSIS